MTSTSKLVTSILLQVVSIFFVIGAHELGWLTVSAKDNNERCCLNNIISPEVTPRRDNNNSTSTKLDKEINIPEINTENPLIGWWKFDESNGIVASDSSGNDIDGALNTEYDSASWQEEKRCVKGRCYI